MAQVKIYGLHTNFEKNRVSLSESIHQSVMEALSYPAEKLFHRFIAFNSDDFVFPSGRTTPEYVLYLGRVLPFAITGMLIVFCLKDIKPLQSPFGIPEMICILAVFAVHRFTHKSMPAIAAGTLLYMALIRIFPML